METQTINLNRREVGTIIHDPESFPLAFQAALDNATRDKVILSAPQYYRLLLSGIDEILAQQRGWEIFLRSAEYFEDIRKENPAVYVSHNGACPLTSNNAPQRLEQTLDRLQENKLRNLSDVVAKEEIELLCLGKYPDGSDGVRVYTWNDFAAATKTREECDALLFTPYVVVLEGVDFFKTVNSYWEAVSQLGSKTDFWELHALSETFSAQKGHRNSLPTENPLDNPLFVARVGGIAYAQDVITLFSSSPKDSLKHYRNWHHYDESVADQGPEGRLLCPSYDGICTYINIKAEYIDGLGKVFKRSCVIIADKNAILEASENVPYL